MYEGKLLRKESGLVLIDDGAHHWLDSSFVISGQSSRAKRNASELIKRWNSHKELVDMVKTLSIELDAAITEVNKHLKKTIHPQMETPPDYWDGQSCHEAQELLHKIRVTK